MKNKILIIILSLFITGFSITSWAEEALSLSESRWTMQVYNLVQSGNADNGQKLAKTAKCASCHGDTGVSEEDDTPSLAGQKAAYTFKQIYDYKQKIRDDKTMYKKVKKLSYQDMADISAWYETQKSEIKSGGAVPAMIVQGDLNRSLIGCDMCHNRTIMPGGFQVPILNGQKIEYLVETLTMFKEGDRENDEYQVMRQIAEKLTDEEIEQTAQYYAAKPSEE